MDMVLIISPSDETSVVIHRPHSNAVVPSDTDVYQKAMMIEFVRGTYIVKQAVHEIRAQPWPFVLMTECPRYAYDANLARRFQCEHEGTGGP